jgi:heptose II phosphotransferase
MIRLVNRAVNRGCHVVQDIYLVAEKKDGRYDRESYVLAQYVEGTPLSQMSGDGPSWPQAMGETLANLHDGGLASNDVLPGNFILTDQGLVVIDISIDRSVLRCQVNDIIRMRQCFDIKMPIRSPLRKIAYVLLSLRDAVRRFWRQLCGRPLPRPKSFLFPKAGGAGLGPKLLAAQRDGWRLLWKNDGADYPQLLEDFKAGRLQSTRLFTNSAYRLVHRLELDGRRLVIKHDWETDSRFEKRLWSRLVGTPYSRLIQLTRRAIDRGCPLVQDVYLVAEKIEGASCREAWLIAEYVEGSSFIAEEYVEGKTVDDLERDFKPWLCAIGNTLADLHDWGLASNDVQPGNFIQTDNGLKVIDLSLDGPIFICQANDMLKMRGWFRVNAPIRGVWRKTVYGIWYIRAALKRFSRRLRGQKPKVWIPKQ